MRKTCIYLAAAMVFALIAAGCGSSGRAYQTTDTTPAATSGASSMAAATITIANMAFPGPLTVSPGAEITVVNNDSVEHSVTSVKQGAFDVEVDGGDKKTLIAPSEPGEYPYKCKYHASMKGTLIVK